MKITSVVPAYKATTKISGVVSELENIVDNIVGVEDSCPQGKSEVLSKSKNKKLTVLKRLEKSGVGAAIRNAINIALENGVEIIVKVDADLQMPTEKIPGLIQPLIDGSAYFSKGNGFDCPEDLGHILQKRPLGNAGLSPISEFNTDH